MKNKNKVLIKNILLSLITIALFLFFFEVSLRTFGPKRDIGIEPTILMKSNNSILFYEMKPNASIIRNGINYYGIPVKYNDWEEAELQFSLYINKLKEEIIKKLKR